MALNTWAKRCCGLILGTLVAVTTTACRRDEPLAAKPAAQTLNVLLITIDTTRPDHLGCYGHPRGATPNIDRLAERGVLFEQCTVSCPITLPSHASILTGLYPYVHRTRTNGLFSLPDSVVTLAESFKAAGYATCAQVAATVMDARYGLDQGFDVYLDPDLAADEPKNARGSRVATGIADQSIAWLNERHGERFFLWAHFFDPHLPYEPPDRFATRYADDPYLAEIAYADEQVGRVFAQLDSLGLSDRTLVVLTTDHGEGLGEHEEPTHSYFLYDSTLAAALIFSGPGITPARRVPDQVRNIDIAPTILSLCGLEPLQPMQGVDLTPRLSGGRQRLELSAYAETFAPYYDLRYAQTRVLRQGGWKYIHAPVPELYHVSDDPRELNNVADREPGRVETMRRQLQALIETAPPAPETQALEPTEQEMARLQALGYLVGSVGDEPENEMAFFEPRGPDPKSRREQLHLADSAQSAIEAGRPDEAEPFLQRLGELEPDNVAFKQMTLRALAALCRHAEAIAMAQSIIDLDAGDAWVRNHYAVALAAVGRHQDALLQFQHAIKLAPHEDMFLSNMGLSFVALGRFDEAQAAFEHARQLRPSSPAALAGLGRCAQARDDPAEAISWYEQALKFDPELLNALNNLGTLLAGQSRTAEAIAYLERAAKVDPRDARIRYNLARLLARSGHQDQARTELQKALDLAIEQDRPDLADVIRQAMQPP